MNPLNAVKSAVWRIAFAFRETGQALERTGCRLQGIYSYEEALCRHMPKMPVQFDAPSTGAGAFIAPSGLMVGNVTANTKASVWYNATVRGDFQPVHIGKNTNIQDNAYVGATSEFSPPAVIHDNVSVGHGAVIKGAEIKENTLIGINAIISEGCVVGSHSIIAAGSYLEENTAVPSGEVWAGNPARKLRDLKPQEREYLKSLPQRYAEMAGRHQQVVDLLHMKQEEFSG